MISKKVRSGRTFFRFLLLFFALSAVQKQRFLVLVLGKRSKRGGFVIGSSVFYSVHPSNLRPIDWIHSIPPLTKGDFCRFAKLLLCLHMRQTPSTTHMYVCMHRVSDFLIVVDTMRIHPVDSKKVRSVGSKSVWAAIVCSLHSALILVHAPLNRQTCCIALG